MRPREFHDTAAQAITDPLPCFNAGRRHRVVSFPGLPPHINSPCSWEKRTGLVGEHHLLPLICRPAHVISKPLQPPLNVMIHGFIEFTANSFGRNWTIEMLIRLISHFGGSSSMLSSHNAFQCTRSLSVSLDVRQELLRLLEVLPYFLNSVIVIDIVTRTNKKCSCLGDWGSCHTSSNDSTFFKLIYVTHYNLTFSKIWKRITIIQSSR